MTRTPTLWVFTVALTLWFGCSDSGPGTNPGGADGTDAAVADVAQGGADDAGSGGGDDAAVLDEDFHGSKPNWPLTPVPQALAAINTIANKSCW